MNQAFGGTPQYYRDAGFGSLCQWIWRGRDDYGAPHAADVDYYITAFEPTAGDWTDISTSILNDGKPDVWRNITLTKTDANNSMMVVVEILGVNQFNSEEREILRLKAADSSVAGKVAWSEVSSIKYKVTGVVGSGADTMSLGIGDVLGLPRQITSEYDVIVAISDTAGAGAGPTDELDSARTTNIEIEYSTIEFEDNDPDGTDLFYVELRPTAPIGGTPPMRPRGEAVTTQSS